MAYIELEANEASAHLFNEKRLLDVVLSILVLPIAIALSLIFGLLFLLINRENPLFVQSRVGQYGQVFRLVKLRTMSSATKNLPTHLVSGADISTLGKIMRAIKVDELPQLYNVLRGDMSLVGPRPCLPTQHELITERINMGVYEAKPGITGYAQVRGIDMSVPKTLALADHVYLQQQKIMLDFSLLLQTVVGRGSGDKTA
ncbi:sugar transferase [Granulosicoccus sp.]|nr:sugar transferase [Granulosicoccus sp.]MDB4222411.1 sugar transferase [Granulosicoccus sp.]